MFSKDVKETGEFFLLKKQSKCEEYYIDSDNDCFLTEDASKQWIDAPVGEMAGAACIEAELYGKVVSVLKIQRNKEMLCYGYDNQEVSLLEDWMGRYIDPIEEPEYFI